MHDIFHAKVGKGGINFLNNFYYYYFVLISCSFNSSLLLERSWKCVCGGGGGSQVSRISLNISNVSHISKKNWANIPKIHPTAEGFVSPYP